MGYRRAAELPILAQLVATAVACGDRAPPGHLVEDTTWSGVVELTGDVFVDPGVTLTVAPGTRVVVAADRDDLAQSQLGEPDEITALDPTGGPSAGGIEYQKSHIAINVAGRIIALGTEDEPIVFTSSKPQPFYTDWVGLSVREGQFAHVVVEWAIFGIGGGTGPGGLTLDHCHVRHMWGACTAFNEPEGPSGQRWIRNSTIEDCGHEAIDTHSPGALEVAWTEIRHTQAGLNLHGTLALRAHHNVITDTTFPVLAENASDVFVTQVTLQAHEEDSSRWTYQGYVMPNMGHGSAAAVFVGMAGTSHVVLTNSIVFDSPVGIRNEAPAGSVESGYLNMDAVDAPYTINATQGAGQLTVDSLFVDRSGRDVRLQAASPARGVGNPVDGRPDLGAFGGVAAQARLGWRGP